MSIDNTTANSSNELVSMSDFRCIALKLIKSSEAGKQKTADLKESDSHTEKNNNQPNQWQSKKSGMECIK